MKNKLKKLRLNKGLTLKELSDTLKKEGISISPDSLAKYERGDRNPKMDKLIQLANFFNVSIPELQGYEEKDQHISIKKMKTLIKDKPNDDYTKLLVAENLRKSQLIDQENKNKLIKQLDNLIVNNQFTDLLLLNSLSDTFIKLYDQGNDEIYTKLQIFLRILLGYVDNEKDRSKKDVKESLQELLSAINKDNS